MPWLDSSFEYDEDLQWSRWRVCGGGGGGVDDDTIDEMWQQDDTEKR